MKRFYQAISFDTNLIQEEIKSKKADPAHLCSLSHQYLDRLRDEGFEVLVQGDKFISGFPPTIILGSDMGVIKLKAYKIAEELGLDKYTGNGPWYAPLHRE
ncbi:MAG: hypothetical protein HY367_02880 [Candidatus Aenigmarchaeota archaeon]|nr:hypothetical protein [Candidatus Aenigmarchaeota archaeon]